MEFDFLLFMQQSRSVRVHTDVRANEINQKLQSRACIVRENMFFRYGEYNPDTPDGLETIIHECVHYGQQSQAQNNIGFKGVIQRNVGFEFEVGLYQVQRLIENTEATQVQPDDLNITGLGKSVVLARGTGFELQIDTGANDRHLEFVTSGNGFPETKAGRAALKTAIEGITALGNEITSKIKTPGLTLNEEGVTQRLVSTDEITNGISTNPKTVILGFEQMRAEPQVTAGIRLDRLAALMENMVSQEGESQAERDSRSNQRSILAYKSNEADRNALRTAPAAAQQAINEFKEQMTNDTRQLPPDFGSESLVGLISLIYTYLKKATLPVVDYPKSLFPLLSHTNFSSMFAMLPNNDRTPFIEDPQRFVNINLNAAQMAGTGGTAFFTGGFPYNPSLNAWSASITRQDWLYNIPQGTDRLGDLAKFGERGDRVGRIHLFATDTMTEAPILELRRMAGRVGIENWKDLALDVFDFIAKLNDLKTQRFESRRFNIRNQK